MTTDIRDEWRDKTHDFKDLEDVAMRIGDVTMSAMDFLVVAGVIPQGAADKWKRSNALPRLGINPAYIPAEYLAEVAFEWSQWGYTTPLDFIDALRVEVAGHERDVIIEALGRLARTHDADID